MSQPDAAAARVGDHTAACTLPPTASGIGPSLTVAACIVNWNTPAATLRCLDALAASVAPLARAIVVDNSSDDDSHARIRTGHPRVHWVQAPANDGFAAGVHRGFGACGDVDAVWLVNSDAMPEPDCLSRLLDAWRSCGDGVYGGVDLHAAPGTPAEIRFPTKFDRDDGRWSPLVRDVRIIDGPDWRGQAPRRVAALVASNLLLPVAVWRTTIAMDTAWFLHCEETDWCLRLTRAGVACRLVPGAVVRHAGGGSHVDRPRVAGAVAYYRARNEVVLARRHLGPAWAAVVAARKLMKGTALLAVSPRRGGAVFHGAIDGIRGRLGKTIAPEAALGAETDDIVRHGGERTVARVMRRLRGTAPAAVNVRRVGASRLATTAHPPPFLAAWHQCVVETIARCILRERLEVDLFIDDTLSGLEPPFAARRIGLQWEHTLVRPGGRDSEGHPLGRTPLPDGRGHYLARVARRAALERCDLVIDYSHANLANLQGVPALAELAARSIVISPLVHGADPSMGQRDLGVITLMHDLAQPRRARFVADAARAGLAVRNFRGVYEPDRLRRLYRRARVLVNLRQTDDHHTLEELRVLPALLCGVVVVSEDVPLRETIPYARHVTWAAADDLVEYARLADADHQRLHAQLFSDGQFDSLVASMRGEDDARLTRALIALAASDR